MLIELNEFKKTNELEEDKRLVLHKLLMARQPILDVVTHKIVVNTDGIRLMREGHKWYQCDSAPQTTRQKFPCVFIQLDNGAELSINVESLDALKMELALKGQKLI